MVDGPKLGRFEVSQGCPAPLGATLRDGGVNFAVYSGNAVSATLCLISLSDLEEVMGFLFLAIIWFWGEKKGIWISEEGFGDC